MTDDVSASFPQITWEDRSIIAVDAGDNNAKITKFTIHLAQDTPDDLLQAPLLPQYFSYVPTE